MKPQGNFSISNKGKHAGLKDVVPNYGLEITQTSGFSNPTLPTPKGRQLNQNSFTVSKAAEEKAKKKREDAELLNQDAMPNL